MKWIESLSGVATRPRRRVAASLKGAMVFWLVAALAPGASASTPGAAAVGSVQTATPSSGAKIDLVISNYQYCRQAPCLWPTEAAYVRGPSGPLPGSDNLNKFVAVSPGDTITWTYKDTAEGGPASCDFYGTPPYPDDETLACVGHAVALEDGTEDGRMLGFLAARSGPGTLTWVVPADAKPGSVMRYFCNVRDLYATVPGGIPHWYGYGGPMTGGLKVVAAGALIGAALSVIPERWD